jgi:hypothetical protein
MQGGRVLAGKRPPAEGRTPALCGGRLKGIRWVRFWRRKSHGFWELGSMVGSFGKSCLAFLGGPLPCGMPPPAEGRAPGVGGG